MRQSLKVLLSIFYFVGLIIFDQLTKQASWQGKLRFSNEFIHLSTHKNFGVALGIGGSNNFFINLLIGSSFTFLAVITLWLLFYFLKSYQLRFLKISILNILAGAGGNALDKITRGYAIDFLEIKFWILKDLFINFADVFLILGIIGVMIEIFRKSSLIWYEANKRKIIIVDSSYQKFEAFLFVSIIWASSFVFFISFLAIITYFKVPKKDELIWLSFAIQFILTVVLSFTAYFFALLHSHRTSGAIYSLKKFIGELSNDEGLNREWKSRESDFHQEILKSCSEDVVNLVKNKKNS
jgi:signal peptidase II